MSAADRNARALVRNPLTVIAVFAGLAEVSATVALPQLDSAIQWIFVWFVMLFPSVLVGLFFFVLWNKHHVLYAPSDYLDEENFMKHWVPSTAPLLLDSQDSAEGDAEPEKTEETPQQPSTPGSSPEVDADAVHSANRRQYERVAEARLAEDVVVRRLTSKYGLKFLRDVEFRDRKDIRYDAIADSPSGPVLVEVKLLSSPNTARVIFERELERLAAVSYRLNKGELRGGKLILVLVLRDEFPAEQISKLKRWAESMIERANLPLSVDLEIQKLSDLKQGETS